MDITLVIMWLGFSFAAYSVVGNDVIQTLGTFLSSNGERKWWQLWLFAAALLSITLVYSWLTFEGDVSYQRLIGDAGPSNPKYPLPDPFSWYYLLPPLVLLVITRYGIPVSTSFLILTFFHPKGLQGMVVKSMIGYLLAFAVALLIYAIVTKFTEKKFISEPLSDKQRQKWVILQWVSTGFLWSQWLIQDFANIYVYLPRQLSTIELFISMVIILGLLAYIFYSKGGKIQGIVKSKTNTEDIRSATIIDFIYALLLLYFKELNNIPMSTTWVFLGLLAGREIALAWKLEGRVVKSQIKPILLDLGKVFMGLVLSIILVYTIQFISGDLQF